MNVLREKFGWTRPDARAFAKVSNLYVASKRQFHKVMQKSVQKQRSGVVSILDVGSGMGSETKKIASVLNVEHINVVTLESSKPLQKTLESEGFTVGDSIPHETKFSLVSLLNVLDRTEDPHALVESALEALVPGGTLLVGAVLPFQDIIEEPWGKWSKPKKRLEIRRKKKASFEVGTYYFLEVRSDEERND